MSRKDKIETNVITSEQQTSMWVRVITSLVAFAVIVPCIFLGDWYYFGLAFILVALASWELVRCAKKKYNPFLYIISFLLTAILAFTPLVRNAIQPYTGDWYLYSNFDTLYLSVFVVVIGIILTFSLVLVDKNFEVRDAAYIATFGIVIGLGIQSLLFMRYYPLNEFYPDGNAIVDQTFNHFGSSSLLFFVAIGSLAADTGAYFTGLLFGRNKINERISPKKTWEGFVGGVLVSLLFTQIFGFAMAANGKPIIASLDLEHWYFILILGVVISLISQLGDFIFSSIKRYYGVKDFGVIFPGHGGVLDRFDSIIFASLSTSILIIIFNSSISGNLGGLFL